jgi:hypothetical protein
LRVRFIRSTLFLSSFLRGCDASRSHGPRRVLLSPAAVAHTIQIQSNPPHFGTEHLVAAHDLAVAKAGSHLEVGHRLNQEQEPVARRTSAVGAYLMNPVGAERWLVGRIWRQSSMNLASAASRLRRRSLKHAANLGMQRLRVESERIAARRIRKSSSA